HAPAIRLLHLRQHGVNDLVQRVRSAQPLGDVFRPELGGRAHNLVLIRLSPPQPIRAERRDPRVLPQRLGVHQQPVHIKHDRLHPAHACVPLSTSSRIAFIWSRNARASAAGSSLKIIPRDELMISPNPVRITPERGAASRTLPIAKSPAPRSVISPTTQSMALI